MYTIEELQAMDIDELDVMAFGYKNDQEVTVSPSDLNLIWPDDMENPRYRFEQEGTDWVNNVDLTEPIEVSISKPGILDLEDGHHRYFAALKTGKSLTARITIKGNPVLAIMQRQQEGSEAISSVEKRKASKHTHKTHLEP